MAIDDGALPSLPKEPVADLASKQEVKAAPSAPSYTRRIFQYTVGTSGSLVSFVPRTLGYTGTSWLGKKLVAGIAGTSAVLGKLTSKVARATKSLSDTALARGVHQKAPQVYGEISQRVLAKTQDLVSLEGDLTQLAGTATQAAVAQIPLVGGIAAAGVATGQATTLLGLTIEKTGLRAAKEYYIPLVQETMKHLTPALLKFTSWASATAASVGEAIEKKAWSVYEHPEAVGEYFTRMADSWYSRSWSIAQKFEYIKPGQALVELSAQEKMELETLTGDDWEVIQFLVLEQSQPEEKALLQQLLAQKTAGSKEALIKKFKTLSFDERLRMTPKQIQNMSPQQKAELFLFILRKAPLDVEERRFLAKKSIRKQATSGNWKTLSPKNAEKLSQYMARAANRLPREEFFDLLAPTSTMLRQLDVEQVFALVTILEKKRPDDLRLEEIREKLESDELLQNKDQSYLLKMMRKHLSNEEKILLYSTIFSHQQMVLSKETIRCLIQDYDVELKQVDLDPERRVELQDAKAVLEKALEAPVEHVSFRNVTEENVEEEKVLSAETIFSLSLTPNAIRANRELEKLIGDSVVSDAPFMTAAMRLSIGLIPLLVAGTAGGAMSLAGKSLRGLAARYELTQEQWEKIEKLPAFSHAQLHSLVTVEESKEKEGTAKRYFVAIAPALMDLAVKSFELAQLIPGFRGVLELAAKNAGIMPLMQTADKVLLAVPTAGGRLIFGSLAKASQYAASGVSSFKDLMNYMIHIRDQSELAEKMNDVMGTKSEEIHKMAEYFYKLAEKVEAYCDAKDKVCSPELRQFFLTSVAPDNATNLALKLSELGLSPEDGKNIATSLKFFLEAGIMPVKAISGEGTMVGYAMAPITEAMKETLSTFSSLFQGTFGYVTGAAISGAKKVASTVIGQEAMNSLGKAAQATKEMPLVQEISKKTTDAVSYGMEKLGDKAQTIVAGVGAITRRAEQISGIRQVISPDTLQALAEFSDAAAKYHTSFVLQKGCEDAQAVIVQLGELWYGQIMKYCAESDTLNFLFRGMQKHVLPTMEGSLKRIQDIGLSGSATTELLNASLQKNAHLEKLVESGLDTLRKTASEAMKQQDSFIAQKSASSLQVLGNTGQILFSCLGGGNLTFLLLATRIFPEMTKSASEWLRVNGRETFSLMGDQIWQSSLGIGSSFQNELARSLTTWLRSGYNWATGTVDPKRIEQFRALEIKEKLHIAHIAMEAEPNQTKREAIGQYMADLQTNNVIESQEIAAATLILKGFSRLTDSEKLAMSPAYYLELDPLTQERVVGLVERYAGLTESEQTDPEAIVKKFNSLNPDERAKLDEIPWWEFSRMNREAQEDLLFKASQDESSVNSATLQERIQLVNQTKLLSTQELKELLKVLQRQDAQKITFTPSYLRHVTSAKIVHAIDLVKRYDITLYNQLVAELRRFDKSADEQVFKEKIGQLITQVQIEPLKAKAQSYALTALACALNALPEYEKRDFFDFTIAEFKEIPAKADIVEFVIAKAQNEEQAKFYVSILADIRAEKELSQKAIQQVVKAFNSLSIEEKRQFRLTSTYKDEMQRRVKNALRKELVKQIAENEVLQNSVSALETKKRYHALESAKLQKDIEKLKKPVDHPDVKKLKKQIEKHKAAFQFAQKEYPIVSAKLKEGLEKERLLRKSLGEKPIATDEFSILKISKTERDNFAQRLGETVSKATDEQVFMTILAQQLKENTSLKLLEAEVVVKAALEKIKIREAEAAKELETANQKISDLGKVLGHEEEIFHLELKVQIIEDLVRLTAHATQAIKNNADRFSAFLKVVKSMTVSEIQDPRQHAPLVDFYKTHFDGMLPPSKEDLENRRKPFSKQPEASDIPPDRDFS